MKPRPIRVTIIGGGCAAVTAAFELTRPELEGRYEVSLYQLGFRLGGKGASGRGPSGRIEEHGLHLWMGYYENAFRLMRECYGELARDPARSRLSAFDSAFVPANLNAAADWSPDGHWLLWKVRFPETAGEPGVAPFRSWKVTDYLIGAVHMLRTLWSTATPDTLPLEPALDALPPASPAVVQSFYERLLKLGALAGLAVAIEALRLLEGALQGLENYPQNLLLRFVGTLHDSARSSIERLARADDEARRLWEVSDIILASLRGCLRFRVALDPRGFDAIDDYDARQWLRLNGASQQSIDSAFLRALYDLAFAYADGDTAKPSFSAGAALRGSMRAFFTYRKAFFWRMTSGMGDVVFAPLFEVLERRGVKFHFFHRLENVGLIEDATGAAAVQSLQLSVQAKTRDGKSYAPLVDVKGVPCWPAEARYDLLEDGERLRAEGVDFESPWEQRVAETRVVRAGEDFDHVVLGLSIGAVPMTCREILQRDERWRDMVEHVRSVPTQAFQLWLNRDMPSLGRPGEPINVCGFVEPFDTWADMSHLIGEEAWALPPRAIAYFCNVLPDDTERSSAGAGFLRAQSQRVYDAAARFLERDLHELWPNAVAAGGGFRWDTLADARRGGDPAGSGAAALASQFWTANVKPSDRYVQALPGTARFRISPLDRSYPNLTLTGDWTSCGLNMGCVEAAVMSGKLAAHAVSGLPKLSDIIGYDHP